MPFANTENYGATGAQYAFWAIKSGVVPHGTDGALESGEDSGMAQAKYITSVNLAFPEDRRIALRGDNGTWAQQVLPADTLPSGASAFGMFDSSFAVAVAKNGIQVSGQYDQVANGVSCREYAPIAMVINSPAKSGETATLGESGWQVTEFLLLDVSNQNPGEMSIDTAQTYSYSLTANEVAYTLYGEAFNDGSATWSRNRAIAIQYSSPFPVTYHTYIGDGTASQTVTLDYTPAAETQNAVQVWDFTPSTQSVTQLDITTNYTISASTKTVTFVTDPSDGNAQIIRYQFDPSC